MRFIVVLIAVVLWPTNSFAQTDAERELAVQLGREGVALYNDQRFEDAFDRFANAEELVHSPVFLIYMARCDHKRGNWVAALDRYDALVIEKFRDDAPKEWMRAREEAELERARLAQQIPTVSIAVGDVPHDRVSVWIDGVFNRSWHAGEVTVDPGPHQIIGQHGAQTARKRINAAPGQKAIPVALGLVAQHDVSSVLARPAPSMGALFQSPSPKPERPKAEATGGQRIAGYFMLSLGGVLAATTLGVGIAALAHDGSFSDQCLDGRCPKAVADDVELLDELQRATLGLGISSAVMFIAGGIVVGTAPKGESPSKRVGLSVGPNGLWVRGSW